MALQGRGLQDTLRYPGRCSRRPCRCRRPPQEHLSLDHLPPAKFLLTTAAVAAPVGACQWRAADTYQRVQPKPAKRMGDAPCGWVD